MTDYKHTTNGEVFSCHQVPDIEDTMTVSNFFGSLGKLPEAVRYDGSTETWRYGSKTLDVGDWLCILRENGTVIFVSDQTFQTNFEPVENVYMLDTRTIEDVPVSRILDAAREHCPHTVIVLGYDKAGDEYFASSIGDETTILWLLERLKHQIISGEFQ